MRAEAVGPGERLLGVRPENVALLGGEAASEAVVRVVEHTGPTTTLLVDWLGSRVHIVVPRRAAVRPGDRVHPAHRRADAPSFSTTETPERKESAMTARSFEPKFMKMSVLTAALQELTPRRIRDEDPDRAIEDWLEFARELDCPNIQISAALHPTRDRRAARGDARPGRQHARSAQAVRQGAGQARAAPRCKRRASAPPTSRSSTTCSTTTTICARRSTTSCCA